MILVVHIIIPACNACGYIVILWVRIIIIILLLLQTLHNDKASDKTRAAPEPMSGTLVALGPLMWLLVVLTPRGQRSRAPGGKM